MEKDIQKECMDYLAMKGFLHWRANQIPVPLPGGGFRKFTGLKGVSDIMGMISQTAIVTDGRKKNKGQRVTFGVLLAVEVKQPGKHPTPEQRDFLRRVEDGGGIALCVHSLDELIEGLDGYQIG